MNSNQTNRNRKSLGPGLPFSFWYVLVAIGFLLVIQNVLFARLFEQLPYSEFKTYLRQDRIEDVQISTHTIRGTLRPSTSEKAPPMRFLTVRVDDPDLVQELEAGLQKAGRNRLEHPFVLAVESGRASVDQIGGWLQQFALWAATRRRVGEDSQGIASHRPIQAEGDPSWRVPA